MAQVQAQTKSRTRSSGIEHDVELKNLAKTFTAPGSNQTVLAVDHINLQIRRGEFFALLGPSGCGKTTTLRLIAGLEQPTSGEILINGEPMQGVPAFHRPVNTVFQDYALFPHMSILQNVMFGLEMENVSKQEARSRAEEALEMVRLPNIANRKPSQLSGGQQQRVALARALVKRPAVLLLDEPLGALDLKLRKEMQFELKSMQSQVGITFIYVTHDQEEALTMADRIAVMSGGHVLQVSSPREMYERPVNRFVADFIGETNFIPGRLVEKVGEMAKVRLNDESVIDAQLPQDHAHITDGMPVIIPIRPERIAIVPESSDFQFPNNPHMTVLPGTLMNSVYIGTDTRYAVRIAGGTEIVARIQNVDYRPGDEFQPGDTVRVYWPVTSSYVLTE